MSFPGATAEMTAVGRSVGNPACATRGTRSGGSRQILVEGVTHDFGTPPPGAFSQSHDLAVGFFGQPDGEMTLPCFASGGPGAHRAGHFVGGGL